jgi:preprotein translocase subunit SecG
VFTFLLIVLVLDAFVLVAVVLLQAGQGGGLAAMSGGASTDTFLGGRQAVTILTKMSWWCGGIFLALSLVLAGLSSRGSRPRSVLEGQIQPPAPVAPLPLNVQPAPGNAGASATPATGTAPKPGGRD